MDPVPFLVNSLNETRPSRLKEIRFQLEESWCDSCCQLWNPPLDLLPMVIRKIEQEKARGIIDVLVWPTQAWLARLQSLHCRFQHLLGHPHRTFKVLASTLGGALRPSKSASAGLTIWHPESRAWTDRIRHEYWRPRGSSSRVSRISLG